MSHVFLIFSTMYIHPDRVSDLSPELTALVSLAMAPAPKPWNYRQATTPSCLACAWMLEIRTVVGPHSEVISLAFEYSPFDE